MWWKHIGNVEKNDKCTLKVKKIWKFVKFGERMS
jgi:hypothetical protein